MGPDRKITPRTALVDQTDARQLRLDPIVESKLDARGGGDDSVGGGRRFQQERVSGSGEGKRESREQARQKAPGHRQSSSTRCVGSS